VRLRQVYPLAAHDVGPADSVLLRLADGTPWAVRGTRQVGGAYILLASPLTAEASTLPTSAAMLPLMDRLTGGWAAVEPPRMDAPPGSGILLPETADAVERPDGTRDAVAAGVTYQLGTEPGVYRIVRGDSILAAYAVNPAAAADLSRLDRRSLAQRLPGWTMHVTTDAAAFGRAAFRERLGRELWRPLLLALLALLALETVIAAAGRARRAAGTTGTAATAGAGAAGTTGAESAGTTRAESATARTGRPEPRSG
jgi:hypothetical protein